MDSIELSFPLSAFLVLHLFAFLLRCCGFLVSQSRFIYNCIGIVDYGSQKRKT